MKKLLITSGLIVFAFLVAKSQTVALASHSSSEVSELNYYFENPAVNRGDTLFITSQSRLHLEWSDANVPHQIGYSVNDSPKQVYREPIPFNLNGFFTIQYFSYNEGKNGNSINTHIDNNGPEVKCFMVYKNINLAELIFDNDKTKKAVNKKVVRLPKHSELKISARDLEAGLSGIFFQFDNSPMQAYSEPVRLLARGRHTLLIEALDLLGNKTYSDTINLIIE